MAGAVMVVVGAGVAGEGGVAQDLLLLELELCRYDKLSYCTFPNAPWPAWQLWLLITQQGSAA